MSIGKKILKKLKQFFLFLKKLLTFNITTIMFGVLLLYMIITVVLYATSDHVTSYQVTVGPLTKNPVAAHWRFVRNSLCRQAAPVILIIMHEKVCR